MMKKSDWEFRFGLGLVVLSLSIYLLHYYIFRDAYYIFYYPILDIAFVPVQVLLVTLVLQKMLEKREKDTLVHKMNMAIGIFFSEMGADLLVRLQEFDTDTSAIRADLCARQDGTLGDFDEIVKKYGSFAPHVNCRKGDLPGLKEFLTGKRQFLLGLLGNPNLLEHDTFTDLLWAVLHLSEELHRRDGFVDQPDADCAHIGGDVKRAYGLLVVEWIAYMKHLQKDYPYLFSLAMRTNPFDSCAKVEVS